MCFDSDVVGNKSHTCPKHLYNWLRYGLLCSRIIIEIWCCQLLGTGIVIALAVAFFCRVGVERIPTAAQSLALVDSKYTVLSAVMTCVRFAMASSMVAAGDFDKCGLGGRLLI